MKNINVKKVVAGAAALALGVGVLGVAIAGNNNGTAFGTVAQSDVYTTSSMTPKVSIVTGTIGDDDAWAQNIANAIASNAKKINPQYESWVAPAAEGGTTVTGDGKLFEKYVIGTPATNTVDYRDYSLLGDYKVKVNTTITANGTDEIKIKDKIGLTTTIAFDDDEDVADLTASIYKRGIDYNVEFTPSIAKDANDSGSRDLKFQIMGKEYTMEEWDGTTLTLVQNKATTPYSEGDVFTVGNYTIEVSNILDTGISDEAYEVELKLKNASGTVVATDVYQAEDEIFEEFLDVSVEIAKVYNTRITVIAGSSVKLELTDGLIEDFPEKDDELWHVKLHKSGNDLAKIQIFNNENETQWKDEDALKAGDEVALPYDFARFKFMGLTEEDTKEVTVEDGYIEYTDSEDDDHKVFFFEEDTLTINNEDAYTTSQTIDDHKLYFKFYTTDVNSEFGTTNPGNEGYFTVQLDNKDGDFLENSSGTWTWGSNTVTTNAKILYSTSDTNVLNAYAGFTNIQIPLYNNESEKLKYGVFISESESDVISQIGVALKTGDQGTIESIPTQKWGIGKTYWKINTDATQSSTYVGATSTDATSIADRDMRSMFELIVDDSGSSTVTAHIDAYTGDLVNTDDTAYSAAKEQVLSTNANLDQEDADDLTWAYTNFGTKYEVDGGKFMATVPDTALKGKIFIGNGTVTTGGTDPAENPYDQYIMTPVTVSDLLKKDSMAATGTLIVVGGHLANTVADGITNTFLAQTGDYIVGKHSNGNIYVAGWTKADTGTAAGELVTTINGW